MVVGLRRWVMKRGVKAVVAVIIFIGGQGCTPATQQSDKVSLSRKSDTAALSSKIKTTTINLGYSEQIANDFTNMTLGWQAGRENPVIAVLADKLAQARQNERAGQISKTELARIEQDVARHLVAEIRRRIRADDRFFDLADVTRHRKTQCLGYTQVFYVTAVSIELAANPINVLELEKRGPLPVGFSHVACLVKLADGKVIMANIVPGGFISEPFAAADTFERMGGYLQLKDKTNSLGIYRKIQILDEKGLAAYAYNNRASAHNTARRFEQAITDCSKAIELSPMLAEAWNNRGVAYRNTGQIERAVGDYIRAVELNPNYPEALNNRGVAYTQLGRFEEAISDYSRAIELNPDLAEGYNNRANAYAKLHKFEQAVSDYDRAIGRNSTLAQAYGNRAVSLAILGKLQGAKKDLLRAVELNPQLLSYAMEMSERFDIHLDLESTPLLAAK
jgi:tetratricopeptide (TPR) repeat protein